nr:transcription initiation factor TFIID subunit 15b-like [Lolium perenne]
MASAMAMAGQVGHGLDDAGRQGVRGHARWMHGLAANQMRAALPSNGRRSGHGGGGRRQNLQAHVAGAIGGDLGRTAGTRGGPGAHRGARGGIGEARGGRSRRWEAVAGAARSPDWRCRGLPGDSRLLEEVEGVVAELPGSSAERGKERSGGDGELWPG